MLPGTSARSNRSRHEDDRHPAAAAKPEIVPSLFVLNSRGATLQGDTLTLTGVMPHSIIFAYRPFDLPATSSPPISSLIGCG